MHEEHRLLVPITYGLTVRYLVPSGLLEQLGRFSQPVVALGWQDDALVAELEAHGYEVVQLPAAELDHRHRMYRRALGILHERRLASPTSAIRRARLRAGVPWVQVLIGEARRMVTLLQLLRPGASRALEDREPAEIARGTNVAAFATFLAQHRIDAVISFTPYHDQDGLLLWAARQAGLPSVTSVISFDNPTTRGRLPVRSERMLVWNEANVDELLRSYPELAADQVTATGAPQFDLHHRDDLVMDEAEWRAELGLPADVPIILYGAGPSFLIADEHRLVSAIDAACAAGRLHGGPHLLVRPHPVDPAPWAGFESSLRCGTVAEPWRSDRPLTAWPDERALALQMSSLAHSSVHVNVCSTMTVDGAVFDRPQVGPRSLPGASRSERRRLRGFYRQEHWRPIARSGGVEMVDSEEQLVAAIDRALRFPAQRRAGRQRLVEAVITWNDGRASERVAAATRHHLGWAIDLAHDPAGSASSKGREEG